MIEWQITNLFASLSKSEVDQERPDGAIVVRAEWQVTGQDQNITASVLGAQEFVYDPSSDFTPYWELTEPQVLDWVHIAMGGQREAYEDMVRQQIAQKKAEPLKLLLPWHRAPVVAKEVSTGNDSLIGGNANDTIGSLS